eukprot:Clim_evm86s152 gene=Clim_evmTU86s152
MKFGVFVAAALVALASRAGASRDGEFILGVQDYTLHRYCLGWKADSIDLRKGECTDEQTMTFVRQPDPSTEQTGQFFRIMATEQKTCLGYDVRRDLGLNQDSIAVIALQECDYNDDRQLFSEQLISVDPADKRSGYLIRNPPLVNARCVDINGNSEPAFRTALPLLLFECTQDANQVFTHIEPNCFSSCSKTYDPICGSDGKSYYNTCEFFNARCFDAVTGEVTIASSGLCPQDCNVGCDESVNMTCAMNSETGKLEEFLNPCLLDARRCELEGPDGDGTVSMEVTTCPHVPPTRIQS